MIAGLWALESNGGALGESLDWIAGLLHRDREHPVLRLLAEAGESVPGAAGMLSTLGAERMNARQLSLPLGTLTLCPLAAAEDPARRRHLARALVEGMAYGLRANIEQAEGAAEQRAASVRLSGGVSRSAFFAQLLADVVGRPVEVTAAHEASALGAALCAGVGAGVFASLAEGAARMVRVARRCEPQAQTSALYGELYPAWNELREARAATDAQAAGLALRGLASAASTPGASAGAGFRPRILVAADLDETGLEALRQIGDVEYQSFRTAMRLLTGPSLARALEGVHIFVTEVDVVNAEALVEAKDLRVIAVCRGDAVNVDLEACTALGIPVLHTPGRNADAVADLTLAFLLMLARKLAEANAFLREPGGKAGDMGRMGRAFTRLQGRELWRKTVGLVGLGAVGRKVVERLRPFGARCLVHDPFLDDDAVRLAGAEPASLAELLAASDFVTLHAAVTESSRGLIGAAELCADAPRRVPRQHRACRAGRRGGARAGARVRAARRRGARRVLGRAARPGSPAAEAAERGRDAPRRRQHRRRRGAPGPHRRGGARAAAPRSGAAPRPQPGYARRVSLGRATTRRRRRDAAAAARARRPGRDRSPEEGGAGARAGPAQRTPRAGAAARRTRVPDAQPRGGSQSVKQQDHMTRLIGAFVEAIVGDPSLQEFARGGQDVTLHFRVSDLDREFHFGFHDGERARQPRPPDVRRRRPARDEGRSARRHVHGPQERDAGGDEWRALVQRRHREGDDAHAT